MQKTKIEWCDYTWNPVKGLCPTGCWYCYARAFYKRFKWDPEIRLDQEELWYRDMPKEPSRIFVGSTIDLFHPKIKTGWIDKILYVVQIPRFSHHTFIFLTKFPERYAMFNFPKNCWLGVTVTKPVDEHKIFELEKNENNLRFISYEPLLRIPTHIPKWIQWIIIGALTGAHSKNYKVDPAWIEVFAQHCGLWKIPIFLKNNLQKVWGKKLIQEFPE